MISTDQEGLGELHTRWMPTRGNAIRIALAYALVSCLWILGSGWLLHQLVRDAGQAAVLEDVKGWFFVAVTASILAWWLSRDFRQIRLSARRLQEDAELMRLMGDNLPGAYVFQYITENRGKPRFTYLGAGVERVHGVKAADVLRDADCLRGLVVPKDRAALDGAEADCAAHLTNLETEVWVRNPDGQLRLLRLHSRPCRTEAGANRWEGIAMDITERHRSEEALRQSEEEFRAMFEMASVGMAQAEPTQGRLLRVNRRFCAISGYSQEELLGMRIQDITHPDDRERDAQLFEGLMRAELPEYKTEKRYVRKDGSIVWANVNVAAVRDASGQPIRTMGTVEDITERRNAQEESLRLSTALEQASESIVITDLKGTIIYVNPAFERISGYTRAEAIGGNPRLLKSGKQSEEFYRELWRTLARGEVWRGHFVNKRKDGTLFEERAAISPVRDASGKIVNYMAIKLDVTREMELEKQFRQAQKLEAIGQLAGGVAHDFNNILTSIMIQSELMTMEANLPLRVHEAAQQIHDDGERASNLTRQLLLFSRKQVMQMRNVDLNEVVTSLAKMLQRIIGEDVRLELRLHPRPLLTHADAGMLDQVLLNLGVNARDAMPEGGPLLIETSELFLDAELAPLHPDTAPGTYVCLSVADAGAGIPPEVLPRIFEPFFTTKEPGKGTGLGLATVFGIVKQHKGWIDVRSEPGHGANFQIYLPACHAVPEDQAAEPPPRGGTETILLAEDDPSVRDATIAFLRHKGYTVLEASNGEEAVRLWENQREKVALLLTDLVMPGGMGGQHLARLLSAEKPALKVVFFSGYSAEMAGKEFPLHDGENFLQKPFRPALLLQTIRRALDM